MILTVTLNPSVDISYSLDTFSMGLTNRCNNVIKTAGGKGLNVTRVLKQLGADVIATGFLGGELGNFIRRELDENNIKFDFCNVKSPTRNCIAIIADGHQTEILESGNNIDEEEQDEFIKKFEQLCSVVSVVTISGSLPKGIDIDFFDKILQIANEKNCKVIVDTSGKVLEHVVKKSNFKPYVIKPNIDEFSELIGKSLDTDEEIKQNMLATDIRLVILSCGSKGAYVKSEGKVYKVMIPKVECVNAVGSGDSFVAGLSYSIDKYMTLQETIKLANACGISNCMNEQTGCIDLKEIQELKEKIIIKEI